jgi:uncharacterized protein YpmB
MERGEINKIRRTFDEDIETSRTYSEVLVDDIIDYCRKKPTKALTIMVAAFAVIAIVAMLTTYKPADDKPIITSEEQAIRIAKNEFDYGEVRSTRIIEGIWYVEMEMPLPIAIPILNKTTKKVIVWINSTSGNTLVLTPDGYLIKGEL